MHSILVYHSISSPAQPLPGDIDISAERFERQLRWLDQWRRVVRLSETLSAPPSDNLTAITFDDGFRDNLTVALPLLEKFQLPITLFVAAGYVGEPGYLSADELREISQHPLVTIGAHGLRHLHFTKLSTADALQELVESRRLLSSITGDTIRYMAWPYGECSSRLEQLCQDAGYSAAWSVWKGRNSRYARWRVPLGRNDNMPRFIAKSTGIYAMTKAKWHRVAEKRESRMNAPIGGQTVLAK